MGGRDESGLKTVPLDIQWIYHEVSPHGSGVRPVGLGVQ